MNFPFVHTSGDTLDFEVTVPDYPSADGWTLKYYLTPRFTTPAQAQVVLTATGNADGTYQVQASPATTAAWAAGAYGWSRLVEKVGARQTLTSSEDQGEVQIRQNPATAAQGYDGRSDARRRLDEVETAIDALASGAVKAYTIGTRSMTKQDLPDMIVWRDRLAAAVANEDAAAKMAAGGPNPRIAGIRFNRI